MLKPIGMTEGHYECRSLEETLPIFTELLAAEVVERSEKQAVVKHPNTKWRLVIHEGGPDSKNKPHTNHYGFRIANSKEVPIAHQYISDHKAQYKIKSVTPPHEAHFAYSIYFKEPGGNDLEIEYYNPAAIKQGSAAVRDQAFYLNESAEQSRYMMSEAEESLAAELSLSGANAWNKLQNNLVSPLNVPFEPNGAPETPPMPASMMGCFTPRRSQSGVCRVMAFSPEVSLSAGWRRAPPKGTVTLGQLRAGRSAARHSAAPNR